MKRYSVQVRNEETGIVEVDTVLEVPDGCTLIVARLEETSKSEPAHAQSNH